MAPLVFFELLGACRRRLAPVEVSRDFCPGRVADNLVLEHPSVAAESSVQVKGPKCAERWWCYLVASVYCPDQLALAVVQTDFVIVPAEQCGYRRRNENHLVSNFGQCWLGHPAIDHGDVIVHIKRLDRLNNGKYLWAFSSVCYLLNVWSCL